MDERNRITISPDEVLQIAIQLQIGLRKLMNTE